MAKVTFNSGTMMLRGKLGDFVFRKVGDQYFLGRKAESRRKPTQAQREHRDRFRRASAYAKWVQRDPALLAVYEPIARARGLRVRAVAIGDWFHPPIVEAIDLRRYKGRAGSVIAIRATDDIGVVRVMVRIEGPGREFIEAGDAVCDGKAWRYNATATLPKGKSVTIEAVAEDRAKQLGVLKITWSGQPKVPKRD